MKSAPIGRLHRAQEIALRREHTPNLRAGSAADLVVSPPEVVLGVDEELRVRRHRLGELDGGKRSPRVTPMIRSSVMS